MAGEVAQLDREVVAGLAVVAGCGNERTDVVCDKCVGVFAGCAKVEKFQTGCVGVVQEVGPVRVCLHVLELDHFAQTEAQDLRANPIALRLSEVLDFSYGCPAQPLHGENLLAGGFGNDGRDGEDRIVLQKLLESDTAFGLTDVIAFPGQLGTGVGNGFVQVKASWEEPRCGE